VQLLLSLLVTVIALGQTKLPRVEPLASSGMA
jgi:hypothetical protein